MKAWHIVAALFGVVIIMTIIKSKQKAGPQGATSNDVILGLSKFGTGLIDFGGKIFVPGASNNESLGNDPSYGTDSGYKYSTTDTIPTWGDSSNTG